MGRSADEATTDALHDIRLKRGGVACGRGEKKTKRLFDHILRCERSDNRVRLRLQCLDLIAQFAG